MDQKLKKIFSYQNWRQSINLGNGYKTPGHVEGSIWDFLNLPTDMKGKSFLDIGANDGLFSFEAERRGAVEVVSSDLYKNNIDTMKNGWSNEGILLAKEYLNSKVQLHTKGVYHVNELNTKFDVVFINDIINWLEDIELAVKNLADTTKETLYLSDGFILDNVNPKQIKPEGQALRYMYNLKFITALLEKYGFRIDSIRELNYQTVFIKNFLGTPKIILSKGTKIYQLPDITSEFFNSEFREETGNLELNDFYHIDTLGWVLKKEVKADYYEPSVFYKIAKKLNLLPFYFGFLKSRHKKQSQTSAYIIKAIKV